MVNVMFVDDDVEEYQLFCEALQEAFPSPVNCVFVNDGQKALDMLSRLVVLPDYIFLDVNMPRMDGVECLRKIKTHSRFKDIRVVMQSNVSSPVELDQIKKLGAQFIQKPKSFNELVSGIRSIIKTMR